MKKSNFKLKIAIIVSFVCVMVGAMGSFYLVNGISDEAYKVAKNKISYKSKELISTKNQINYLEINGFNYSKVDIKKSEDGINRVLVKYKEGFAEPSADFSKEFEDKLEINYNKKNLKKYYGTFDIVERWIDEYLDNDIHVSYFLLGGLNKIENETALEIQLVNPTQVFGYFNLKNTNVISEIVKNELDLKKFDIQKYKKYSSRLNDFSSIHYFQKEFKLYNYSDDEYQLDNIISEKLYLETDKIENLLIYGNYENTESKYHKYYEFNAENIENNFEIDLSNINSNIIVNKAKNVVIKGIPNNSTVIKIIYKSKDSDVEKHFTILGNDGNDNNYSKENISIVVDAENIYRTESNKNKITNVESENVKKIK